ncbi:MAG: ATP-dependent RecD-like DNA helicase [Oscillospiraceae bacterium]|nr:ATP-dependent RecD-like DNA helicase [Oscillospiraceae bacterium]
MNEIITITGTVEEIIFSNPDNGYTICGIDSTEEGLFTATGYMPFLSEGESVALSGIWVTHPDYGEQFKVEYYEKVMPSDEESIIRYLGSGIIPGIREATAKKLVKHFGCEVLDIMLANPESLSEIKGISKEKAKKIGEEFQKLQSMQNIVMFLQQYNISANMAVKVHNVLGAAAVDMIKKNPYIMSDMVDGITFKTADTIAFNMGMPKNSIIRIRAGIKNILRTAAYTHGHVYLPKTVLLEHAVYTLKVEESEAEAAVSELIASKDIFLDNVEGTDAYYLYEYYEAEYYIARRLIAISQSKQKFTMTEDEAEMAIDALEEKTGLYLEGEQRNAVVTALSTGCMVLTGGPGTGKTTTINTIIKLLEDLKLSIALAAPTGRAAKRMSQVTGCEAKTIHRLLGTQRNSEGYSVFSHNEEHPLSADVIILDEVSMIDISLMSSFLKAVKQGARIILSGDADQLPSVGPGNIIHDMIESNTIPVIQLNRIFRQAEESLIIVNAHKINRGEMPDLSVKSSDFFFLKRQTPQDSAYTVNDLFKNRLPKSYGVNPVSSIQVLSPTKKGLAGTVALNKLIQAHINPYDETRPQYVYGGTTFRVGDKVMQTKNNYDMIFSRENGEDGMGIFNGDMGIIESISVRDKYMNIIFDEDKNVEYPFTNLDELDLAYAITVHKSQGSEFPIVVMPVCSFAPMLMSRNLFYTAVTRARDMVVLVGSEKTVRNMTLNNQFKQRFTGLTEKLMAIQKFTIQKNNT